MKQEAAYYVGIHRFSYRGGEPARILGVVFMNNRPCYEVLFLDHSKDIVPIVDIENYVIISEQDFLENNIPDIAK
jgi:hypothetical protein